MRAFVTGSSGHLGEALVRVLRDEGHDVISLDVLESEFTTHVGSITDGLLVRDCMAGVDAVFHAATLHKPHVATTSRQAFIDTNISGTLTLLEAAVAAGVGSFVFTSTTSVFGAALTPADGAVAWVTEELRPIPKNIYGVTKAAAEDLCELFHRRESLSCIVLRTSRFFPEADDDESIRARYSDENHKANEYLFRRVGIDDVVSAHLLAAQRAPTIGFGKYILSATTPFSRDDLPELRDRAPAVVCRLYPEYEAEYARRSWTMMAGIDRVYVNERARRELGWQPVYDFQHVLTRLRAGESIRSDLARAVGSKGYHSTTFVEGPYPVE